MLDGISPLLTPKQVAELLKVSLKTVYDNIKLLGGFWPAGIRVLRFRHEDIERILEGPRNQSADDRWAILWERRVQREKKRKETPGQDADRKRLVRELGALGLHVDEHLAPIQPEQKSEKKAS